MAEHTEEDVALEVVTLTDENGDDQDFAFLTLVELEEGPFAVLAPVEQLEGDDPAGPQLDLYAFVFIEHDNGDIELDAVEDEGTLQRIFEVAEQMVFGHALDDELDEE